jgi:hypothetical protein
MHYVVHVVSWVKHLKQRPDFVGNLVIVSLLLLYLGLSLSKNVECASAHSTSLNPALMNRTC